MNFFKNAKFIFLFSILMFLIPPVSAEASYGLVCNQNRINIIMTQLNYDRVKIHFWGDHISLVIPLEKVFVQNSTQAKQAGAEILNHIILFLRCYKKITVSVIVNNHFDQSNVINNALSEKQARIVTNYLHAQNINTQLVSGIGNMNPIATAPQIIIMTKRLL